MADRVLSPGQKAGYALGRFGAAVLNLMIATWPLYFYSPPPGVGRQLLPVRLSALALTAGRVVDALADPVVGYASDHTRSPWGRRLPYLVGGWVPLTLVFLAVWHPPDDASFGYLAVCLGLFFFLYTVVMCPYSALLPELAQDIGERTDISGLGALAQMAAGALIGLASGLMIRPLGYRGTALVMAGLALPGFLVAARAVRNHVDRRPPTAYPLLRGLRQVLCSPAFRCYLLAAASVWVGLNLVANSLPYYVTGVLGRPREHVGILMGMNLAACAVSVPLVKKLCVRASPGRVFTGASASLGALLPLLGVISGGGESLAFVGAMTVMVLAFLACVYITPLVLVSEVVELDARVTGERKEATYFGFNGVVLKGSLALAAALLSVLFHSFGYEPGWSYGVQAAGPVAGFLTMTGSVILVGCQRALGTGQTQLHGG